MKDLTVKYLGPGICYAKVSINGVTYRFSDRFNLYNKIFNELTEKSFDDIVKDYFLHLNEESALKLLDSLTSLVKSRMEEKKQ